MGLELHRLEERPRPHPQLSTVVCANHTPAHICDPDWAAAFTKARLAEEAR